MYYSLIVAAVVIAITFIIASIQDLRTRTVYRITWCPAAVVAVICAAVFWWQTLPDAIPVLVLSLIIALLMILFAVFGLFGKADAIAIVILAIGVPVTPFAAYLFPSLALSSIINACIVSLIIPAVCLIYNLIKKNKAPFLVKCSGFPVDSRNLLRQYGFIAEEIIEDENGMMRKSFRKTHGVFSSLRTNSATFIRTLRENPDKYRNEIIRYQKVDKVWISIGIPFLVPLTIGFLFALFGISAVDLVFSLW